MPSPGFGRHQSGSAGLAHLTWLAVAGAGLPGTAWAEDGLGFEGTVIGTYQTAEHASVSGQPVRAEGSGALDLSLSLPAAGGAVEAQVRGATTPRRNGVAAVLPEANASVGETLDNDDQGRIVVWQAFFRHDLGPGSLAAGLIDPSGWLDGNDVANNEFTQFLGASFVNNLTIDLPSATIGAAYTAGLADGWAVAVLAANATGIEPDYEQALHLGRHGNGMFAAVEVQWSGPDLGANLGVWTNTRKHDTDGDGIDDERLKAASASGVYANLSGPLGRGRWNLRLGGADAGVQPAAGFVGLALAYPVGNAVLGMGAAHTIASHKLPAPHRDLSQAEVYLRVPLGRGFTISPDVQYIAHSDFNPSQNGTWIAGLRMAWSF